MVEPIDIRTGKPFVSRRCHEHHLPPSDGASLGGGLGRARGLLGGCFMGCMMARQSGGGWSNPYVTDGLVQYYDGIWNAGAGVHDSSATTWKDLIGTNNASIVNGGSFGDTYLYVFGATQKAPSATYAGDITNEYSLEACLSIDNNINYNNARITAENPYPSIYFTSYVVDGRISVNFRFYGQGIDTSTERRYVDTQPITLTITYSATQWYYYLNGAIIDSRTIDIFPTSVDVASIGNRLSGGRGFDGRIYALRRYDRALTSYEVMANSAMDAARFGVA